jgi:hypothetical protein
MRRQPTGSRGPSRWYEICIARSTPPWQGCPSSAGHDLALRRKIRGFGNGAWQSGDDDGWGFRYRKSHVPNAIHSKLAPFLPPVSNSPTPFQSAYSSFNSFSFENIKTFACQPSTSQPPGFPRFKLGAAHAHPTTTAEIVGNMRLAAGPDGSAALQVPPQYTRRCAVCGVHARCCIPNSVPHNALAAYVTYVTYCTSTGSLARDVRLGLYMARGVWEETAAVVGTMLSHFTI